LFPRAVVTAAGMILAVTIVGCGQRKAVSAAAGGGPPPQAMANGTTAGSLSAPAPLGAATKPASAPAGGGKFDGSKWGFSVEYPAGWVIKQSQDYEMFVVPAGSANDEPSVSMDVPSLPVHVPGMIPFKLVKNGYLDDMKKAHPDVQVHDETAPTVAGAKDALVTCTWKKDGKASSETALIMVHGDHVYIVRANYGEGGEKEARSAFDAVVKSLKWTK
jgi:hypothetical protein